MQSVSATLPNTIPLEASPAKRALRRLLRRRGAMLGLVIVVFFVLLAVFASSIAPYDPIATSWSAVRKAPSAQYLFGTDEIGRDVLSRVIWGARASLLAGLVSVCISMTLGVPIGLLAGYMGGWTDSLISRFTDAMLDAKTASSTKNTTITSPNMAPRLRSSRRKARFAGEASSGMMFGTVALALCIFSLADVG